MENRIQPEIGSLLAEEQKRNFSRSSWPALTHTKGCQCPLCVRAGLEGECRNLDHERGCQCGEEPRDDDN